eukprot:10512324-Alexandrium_andersonii.AAC.1
MGRQTLADILPLVRERLARRARHEQMLATCARGPGVPHFSNAVEELAQHVAVHVLAEGLGR